MLNCKLGGLPRPLTLGEVASRSDDGEGKPASGGAPRQFRLRLRWSNHHANLPKGTAKPRAQLLVSVLALSGASRQLPQRGSFFEKANFPVHPKPLTLGEVASRSDDGEGKPASGGAPRQFRLRLRWSNHHANLPKGTAKPRAQLLVSVLALSGASRQLPQRGSPWQRREV